MLYLNDRDIAGMPLDWPVLFQRIEQALNSVESGDYAQPVKPYLRFGDPRNRIIAMPAYAGGNLRKAGIKWIASFPGNLERGMPRAHNIILLNDADTGRPEAFFLSNKLNAIRTAAVSGVMMKHAGVAERKDLIAAVIGWGPIGRLHAQLCLEAFGSAIREIRIYDVRKEELVSEEGEVQYPLMRVTETWQEAYSGADLVFNCTVSPFRYIDEGPKAGALLMDISLRDYKLEALKHAEAIVVDSWDEVCRENTDIELLARHTGLDRNAVIPLHEAVSGRSPRFGDATILFCPMGMAVFDVSIAGYYYEEAIRTGIGIQLERE